MTAGTLREGAYSGGSRMAAPWPRPEDEDQGAAPVAEPDEPDEDEDQGDDDEDQGDEPARPAAPQWASDGAGWVLGMLVWGWVVLPFIKGGPAQVKRVAMAKFFNKAADGSELP